MCFATYFRQVVQKCKEIVYFAIRREEILVSFTKGLSEILILCIFSLIVEILIFHFHTYFVFCKKAVKYRETGEYLVAVGAAIFRWRVFRYTSLSNSCQIITSKDSLFRRGFFTLDMLDLPQEIKTLIQWLSFRFVSLIFTQMDI